MSSRKLLRTPQHSSLLRPCFAQMAKEPSLCFNSKTATCLTEEVDISDSSLCGSCSVILDLVVSIKPATTNQKVSFWNVIRCESNRCTWPEQWSATVIFIFTPQQFQVNVGDVSEKACTAVVCSFARL